MKTKTQAQAPASKVEWWHYVLAFLAVLFVAFEAYGPALRGEFIFDDTYLPFMMPGVADGPLRGWLGVRPLLMLTYWFNYQSSGLDPYPYHFVNVLFHALNAVLTYLVVRKCLGFVGEEGWRRETLSIFSGLLFLFHPVQTEAVAYVVGRSETLSVLFFLLAYAAFLYRRRPDVTWDRSILILILFGMACSVKEHTTVLPGLLLLTDFYFKTPFSLEGARRNWRLYVPIGLAGILGVVAVFKVLSRADSAGFAIKDFTWYQYLYTQFRAFWLYVRLYFFPVEQNGDYGWTASRNIFDQLAFVGLIAILITAGLAWRYRREFPLASFGFFGMLLLLAPTSSVVPILDLAVERRLYLPFVCLLLITADFLRRWKASRTTVSLALTGVIVIAAVACYQRAQVWSSGLAFWTDTAKKSPNNQRALFQLAFAQYAAGGCYESVANYEKAAKLSPPDDRLLIDWGLALDCAGKSGEALEKLNAALAKTPTAHVYALIGMVHGKRNEFDQSLAALVTAEKLDPNFDMIYVYRGHVYLNRGQVQEAMAEYQRALSLNPKNEAARNSIQVATARQQVDENRR